MWTSTQKYGTHTLKGSDGKTYTFNNDAWSDTAGPQEIWAVSNNNWGVTSQQVFNTDTWVQTYPHIGWAGGKKLSQYPAIVGTSTAKGPGYSASLQWETAYDIWLNASTPGADDGYEIMVWTDVSNVSPGKTYLGTTVIGDTYKVYQGEGGNGPATWYVRQGNTQTATAHLKTLIYHAVTLPHTNYSGPADPVVSTVEFGWEVWGTGGKPVKFSCSRFSLSNNA